MFRRMRWHQAEGTCPPSWSGFRVPVGALPRSKSTVNTETRTPRSASDQCAHRVLHCRCQGEEKEREPHTSVAASCRPEGTTHLHRFGRMLGHKPLLKLSNMCQAVVF